uniref:Uncharacterized protein n=1 Tax=Oryza brachyantha TaxID=4533 RepID=J3LQ02_ORYBR
MIGANPPRPWNSPIMGLTLIGLDLRIFPLVPLEMSLSRVSCNQTCNPRIFAC